jgi:hypothetical protein
MTHQPDIAQRANRRAIALLLAAVALPSTAFAQETVAPPTVPVPSQQAPAPAPATPSESRTRIAPGVLEQAEQEERERAAAARAERAQARPQQRAERAAPVAQRAAPPARAAAPAPEPAQVPEPQPAEPAAPVAATPEATPPVEAAPPLTEAPVTTTETAATPVPAIDGGSSLWLILAALGLAAAAIAAFLLLRRRRDDDVVYEEPTPVAASEPVRAPVMRDKPAPETVATPAPPLAAAPLFANKPAAAETAAGAEESDEPQPALENAELVTPDAADIDAVLGGAKPKGDRPQLELAVRPTRAGMSRRGAMVEFELTVANAGGAAAEDVRIGAFMLGANAAADSDIQRLLMDPPVDQVVPAKRIEPGDGTQLNASVTLPRGQVDAATGAADEGFTPVLVADARYRLPDGGEGRTAAAFTIGRVNGGEALVPIALQDDPAVYADVEARLHSVPAKV